MGAARAISTDVSVYTLGGSSFLGDIRNASLTIDVGEEESSILTRIYEGHSATARSATLKTSHLSRLSGSTAVSNVEVTAFTLDGTSHIGNLEGGSFTVEWIHAEGKGMVDKWLYPVLAKKRISGEGTLLVPATSGAGMALVAASATVADLDVTYAVTINAVSFSFEGFLKSFEHAISMAEVQKHTVQILGKDPDSGTYPSAPTGTATLPATFVNGTAALAMVLTSKLVGGVSYAGDFLPKSMTVRFNQAGLVQTEYEFASQGTLTPTATV